MNEQIIISTDCALDSLFHDPDDSLAILYLAKTLNVEAILTTYGNTSEENVFESISQVLLESNLTIPIIRGAKNKHDLNHDAGKFLSGLNATNYTIASIGPLTNFKLLNPTQLGSFQKFCVMGGAVKIKGNIPPFYKTEFNFFKDKEAVAYIFENRQIDLVPLDATRKIYLNDEFISQFSSKHPFSKRVRQWNRLNQWLLRPGSNPHDLIMAIAMTNPELFNTSKVGIKIVNGQTIEDTNSPHHTLYSITNPDPIYKRLSILL